MLVKQVGHISRRERILKAKHHPTSNTAAVVTLALVAGQEHVIHGVQWSYNGAPTGGRLTMTDGTDTWDIDITAAGPGGYAPLWGGAEGAQVTITLAAGGSGVTGKLNVQYTTESSESE